MEPASIRYKNPGAMWPGALPTKWGSKRWVYLNDGTGQGGGGHGNKIAIFETWADGICAQLDLWRTSKNYKNKRFGDAIAIWSGGNHVESYIKFVCDRVPGMTRNTVMDDTFWRSSMAPGFLKAQAWHEAGKRYPAGDSDWTEAQKRVMGGIKPTANTVKKAAVAVSTGVVPAVAAGTQGGLGIWTALAIGLGIALVVFLVWKFKPRDAAKEVPATPVTPTYDDIPTEKPDVVTQ